MRNPQERYAYEDIKKTIAQIAPTLWIGVIAYSSLIDSPQLATNSGIILIPLTLIAIVLWIYQLRKKPSIS